jgi:Mn2+/Fe2+ NRAMP family transporter
MGSINEEPPAPPQRLEALRSGHPARWLTVFGPGAVIASLTIGSGELIFSSRGGALFGYRMLSVFLLVCLLKWALTFATARHLVLTGAHPFQRWMGLPGPRGWLPVVFLLLAIPAFPIFVSFHSGTLGTLVAALTGSSDSLEGSGYLVWGFAILVAIGTLALTGGYRQLEIVQLVVVALLLVSTVLAVFLIRPDWFAMLKGIFTLPVTAYPDWIEKYPEIANRPVWVELTTYVGVVGGSGYDYLAYGAFLREKHWGNAGKTVITDEPAKIESARDWIRAPLVDCAISFTIVFLFSAVFVACGTEVLAVHEQIPKGDNLLTLQAEFVAVVSPWLKPIYYAGAILAMAGTLYGTIKVAPAILRELARALLPEKAKLWQSSRLERVAVIWVCLGGVVVLVLKLATASSQQPPGLIELVTPANLFTGVFACGIICLLSVWADQRHLSKRLRPPVVVTILNILGGILFLFLGIKGYWDHSGSRAMFIFAGTVVAGFIGAGLILHTKRSRAR